VRTSSIIGSLRWWHAAVLRGLGKAACDPVATSGGCGSAGCASSLEHGGRRGFLMRRTRGTTGRATARGYGLRTNARAPAGGARAKAGREHPRADCPVRQGLALRLQRRKTVVRRRADTCAAGGETDISLVKASYGWPQVGPSEARHRREWASVRWSPPSRTKRGPRIWTPYWNAQTHSRPVPPREDVLLQDRLSGAFDRFNATAARSPRRRVGGVRRSGFSPISPVVRDVCVALPCRRRLLGSGPLSAGHSALGEATGEATRSRRHELQRSARTLRRRVPRLGCPRQPRVRYRTEHR